MLRGAIAALILSALAIVPAACSSGPDDAVGTQDRIVAATPSAGDSVPTAQRFFEAVYGCSGETLEALAHPDVRMSYAIFEERFLTPVIEGRDAISEFSAGFCRRWLDPEVTVHEAISEGNRVVLVWSFSAVSAAEGADPDGRAGWGGISVFEMDERGRVLAEYGEESTPGPAERMRR